MRRVVCSPVCCGRFRFFCSSFDSCSGAYNQGKLFTAKGDFSAEGCIQLPAICQALRIIYPSPQYPATMVGAVPVDHRDPCVVWREYFSFEHGRPYYHDTQTNLTTFIVPEGFVTRFPLFYCRRGFVVDAENRVYRRATTGGPGASCVGGGSSAPEGEGEKPLPAGPQLTAKGKLAAYGGGGFFLYLIVHNVLLACIFFSLYFLHFDLVGLAESYGFNIGGDKSGSTFDDEVTLNEKKKYPSFWATLGISILLNKLLVPVEVAVTVLMAPILVPRLQPVTAKLVSYMNALMKKGRSDL